MGTQNHEGIVGAATAVEYLASLARTDDGTASVNRRERLRSVFEVFHQRGSILLKQLWDGLSELKGVTLFGPPPGPSRTPTLAFTVGIESSAEVSRSLANRGVFASHGDFYATTVAARLGVGESGFVRIGCACYTTSDEIARVVEAVRRVVAGDA